MIFYVLKVVFGIGRRLQLVHFHSIGVQHNFHGLRSIPVGPGNSFDFSNRFVDLNHSKKKMESMCGSKI